MANATVMSLVFGLLGLVPLCAAVYLFVLPVRALLNNVR